MWFVKYISVVRKISRQIRISGTPKNRLHGVYETVDCYCTTCEIGSFFG